MQLKNLVEQPVEVIGYFPCQQQVVIIGFFFGPYTGISQVGVGFITIVDENRPGREVLKNTYLGCKVFGGTYRPVGACEI